MLFEDLKNAKSKNILLLQGPMGPFFKKFSENLSSDGHKIYKINFNAGDKLYFKGPNVVNFHQGLEKWPDFFKAFIKQHHIQVVFLFGKKRPYHQIVRDLSTSLKLHTFCLDEGILRPHYVTIEPYNFKLPARNILLSYNKKNRDKPLTFHPFSQMAWCATCYALALTFLPYKNSLHHRKLNALYEALVWSYAGLKKMMLSLKNKNEPQTNNRPYFTVILQVHNDYQIQNYRFKSVQAFIIEVMRSFAKHAPGNHTLVLKHHPLDIAYTNYSSLIEKLAKRYGLAGRVQYLLEGYLPTLLKGSQGVVCINSSVGFSALQKGIPVKVLGQCIYDLPGLTTQRSLAQFWTSYESVDKQLCHSLVQYLLETTQFNSNFYAQAKEGPQREPYLELDNGSN